jgi:hypothetical protein
MVNDAIPFYEDGDELTGLATAAVTGKRFVSISGDRPASGEAASVAPSGAGDNALGVAMYDAAINKRVTVKTIESGNVMPVTASGAIAAGDSVVAGAAGVAVAAAGGAGTTVACLGIALTGAVDGADAQILLTRHSVTF